MMLAKVIGETKVEELYCNTNVDPVGISGSPSFRQGSTLTLRTGGMVKGERHLEP